MQFDSFSSFLSMGGYAFYVWLSFGVTGGAMLLLALQSYLQHKSLLNTVVVEQERRARVKKARDNASM
jgi:heme exporter protein D